MNLLLLSDSYKVSHYKQYPTGTTHIYSYFESRGGRFDEVVFFGLQYLIKKYLTGKVVTRRKIDEAAALYAPHFGNADLFNRAGWEYILEKHDGRLPIEIKAVPEGTRVGTHNVLMTVENTDPNCFWLTNYLESLLVQTWYGTTVATQSFKIKQLIIKALEETGDPSLIDFKLHDFGFRGVSSVESAAIGGAAHLINFKGTDTVVALDFIERYYPHPPSLQRGNSVGVPPLEVKGMGNSIPAAEHSTITSWGRENEALAYENMLNQYPEGLVAVVSDSYNIYNACANIWGGTLKEKILNRKGTLVVRPDSGIPKDIVLEIITILGEKFGFTTNEKGYKVLHPNIRVIQGDGVDYVSIGEILENLKNAGWSADNIAFGMGGALLQKLDRDTQKFAFKCSAARINGQEIEVYKDPITDQGKKSKRGRLKLVQTQMGFITKNQHEEGKNCLVTVFKNGKVTKKYSFDECRNYIMA